MGQQHHQKHWPNSRSSSNMSINLATSTTAQYLMTHNGNNTITKQRPTNIRMINTTDQCNKRKTNLILKYAKKSSLSNITTDNQSSKQNATTTITTKLNKSNCYSYKLNDNDKILRIKKANLNSSSFGSSYLVIDHKSNPTGISNTTNTTTTHQQQTHPASSTMTATNNNSAMASSSISRQHLIARAKSIIGKLSNSHGPELRRTLFSLRQTLHDDHELASAFIELDGFESLMRAALDADQIHQNYILRAIGQLIARPNGMSGLTRHNQTIQWLYSMIASQNRLVVKTSIKLLQSFIEHSDNNCLLFCRAIKQVDQSKGASPWTNVVRLFRQDDKSNGKQQATASASNTKAASGANPSEPQPAHDVDLLIDAMTLVNSTLAGIPDQDTYYDFVEPLEAAGMEAIANRLAQLDSPQLNEQFAIYEQALRAEDESSESTNNNNNTSARARSDRRGRRAESDENNSNNSTSKDTSAESSHNIGASQRAQDSSESKSAIMAPNTAADKKESPDDVAINASNADVKSEAQREQPRSHRGDIERRNSSGQSANGCRSWKPPVSSIKAANGARDEQLATSAPATTTDTEVESECTNDDNYESANDDDVGAGAAGAIAVAKETTTGLSAIDARLSSQQQQRKQKSSNSDSDDDVNTCFTNSTMVPAKLIQAKTVHFSPESKQKSTLRDSTIQQQHEKVSATCTTSKQAQVKQSLSRGKQQRASISSCSSSDSYASYGSGYASGSSNSTDHEQKMNANTVGPGENVTSVARTTGSHHDSGIVETSTHSSSLIAMQYSDNCGQSNGAINSSQAGENELLDANKSDDDEEHSMKLRRDLNELEQLTDELANRNVKSTSKGCLKLASRAGSLSNSSSLISTGSDTSSISKNDDIAPSRQSHNNGETYHDQVDFVQKTSNLTIEEHAESRSTSTTPTIVSQQRNTSSSGFSSTNLKKQVSTSEANNVINQAKLTRPQHHQTSTNNVHTHKDAQSQPLSKFAKLSNTSGTKQEPYYHNLFHWEQLLSKGVTRPLLINDLDFTDLRDEDDCDLLNSNSNQPNNGAHNIKSRNQTSGEPLTINIPAAQQHIQGKLSADQESADSGASTGSPAGNSNLGTPASAPPPLPPPPISPWFNTISGSRPQSQFMSSPSPPPYEFGNRPGQRQLLQQSAQGEFVRDQSPANSTYSSCSRNSICAPLQNNFKTLQTGGNLRSASSMSSLLFGNNAKYANKRKKTMKLFWKEVREDRSLLSKLTREKTIWDEVKPAPIDTARLEYLFESKAKDLLSKSRNGLDGSNQRKVKITVLDAKRSNAINIGMTKLPPMRTIKSAILKMDSSIMNREGIEKILTTMMPSEEEKSRIIEAQLANPDTPLGTAEQFLLNLASISALEARLKLWAFQLDYTQIEKEVAEPLMDLKQAIVEIESSETFRIILGTLLAIGNFLNSTNVKGFQIDYLEKVPEVKDTVHKHSLLHHLCLFIQEKYDPQATTDLYSEFSAVNRASKVDYAEVAKNLKKMQQDCKASWDYLKIVAKHDGLANLMNACTNSMAMNSSSTEAQSNNPPATSGKLNNLGKLSMITSMITSDNSGSVNSEHQSQPPTAKQLKTKVSDFLTDCAERIMVLMVIHRRVMNRFQKLLVYLGCPSHQIKQTQPQQILKIINEFALEYRTKRERVREMLMKRQQCQHYNHRHDGANGHCDNRWQLNRNRWAGSQQSIDSASYGNQFGRPCSTASLYANSNPLNCCRDSVCNIPLTSRLCGDRRSIEPHHLNNSNRPGSPSGSQISNYSDYLFDRSCCNSRQESITPVPLGSNRRLQSMSMFDLQNQKLNGSNINNSDPVGTEQEDRDSNREKDEQLRRLLGAGRSFDGACNELYQMSHWSSTIARVPRHPPTPGSTSKLRSTSIDSPSCDMNASDTKHQSSYYKHLNSNQDDDMEQNSDDEILQCLVRAATAKSNYNSPNRCRGSAANRSNVTSTNQINKELIRSKVGLR